MRPLPSALRHAALALTLATGTAGIAMLYAPPAAAQEADIGTFYQELSQYGRWYDHPYHGYVWTPDVDQDWRPYTIGQWVWTEEHGWYWNSDEPFGWAVFHYGRWFWDPDLGWAWVPGTEWGPAWVAWRYSDDDDDRAQVGWAPLPPDVDWSETRGLSAVPRYLEAPEFATLWNFVPVRRMTQPNVRSYIIPLQRNANLVRRTAMRVEYRSIDRRIINRGFDPRRYERVVRRPIEVVRIRPTEIRPSGRDFRPRTVSPGVIETYRPRIVTRPAATPPPRIVEPPRGSEWHERWRRDRDSRRDDRDRREPRFDAGRDRDRSPGRIEDSGRDRDRDRTSGPGRIEGPGRDRDRPPGGERWRPAAPSDRPDHRGPAVVRPEPGPTIRVEPPTRPLEGRRPQDTGAPPPTTTGRPPADIPRTGPIERPERRETPATRTEPVAPRDTTPPRAAVPPPPPPPAAVAPPPAATPPPARPAAVPPPPAAVQPPPPAAVPPTPPAAAPTPPRGEPTRPGDGGRPPRAEGDGPRGGDGPRQPRGDGERPPRAEGERPPRAEGDRGPRPDRPDGERRRREGEGAPAPR